MSRQRAGAKKEEESSGLGFLGAMVVAGGAAAIGYMANDLWKSYKEQTSKEEALASQRSELEKQDARRKARPSTDDVPDALRCVVCLDNQREIVIEPCGHVSVCLDCGDKIKDCPICHGRIENKKLVFVS